MVPKGVAEKIINIASVGRASRGATPEFSGYWFYHAKQKVVSSPSTHDFWRASGGIHNIQVNAIAPRMVPNQHVAK